MDIGPYIFSLFLTVPIAVLLQALLQWLTASWRRDSVPNSQKMLWAFLRAFPFVLAFAPTMPVRGGVILLSPATLSLCSDLYEHVLKGRPADANDSRNLA